MTHYTPEVCLSAPPDPRFGTASCSINRARVD